MTIRYLDPAEQAMMAWLLERALRHWAPATSAARQQERRDLAYALAWFRAKCE